MLLLIGVFVVALTALVDPYQERPEDKPLAPEVVLRKLAVERCILQVKIAEADLQEAKADLERMRVRQPDVAREEYELCALRLRRAELLVAQARVDQKYAELDHDLTAQRLQRQRSTDTGQPVRPSDVTERTQSFMVAGRIAAVLVKPGDVIKVGQVMAQLDDSLAVKEVELHRLGLERCTLALQAAEVAEQTKKLLLQRSEELLKRKALSDADHDIDVMHAKRAKLATEQARQKLTLAKTLLQKAELTLRWHTLTSDFTGVVTSVSKQPKESIAAHQPFLTIRVAMAK